MLALPLLSLWLVFPSPQEGPPERGVELTHLANEGFRLRSAGGTVLIDAFLEEPYSLYEALPEERLAALLEAREGFGGPALCLASHVHRDHFQPVPAAAYLRANPRARLVSSFDVVAALRAEDAELADGPRVEALFPRDSSATRRFDGDLEVRFLDLPHVGARWAELQNLGHEIRIGGLLVLHVGDADTVPERWRRHRIEERRYDLALIPYWFFESAEGRTILREVVHAEHLVACHVPPGERAAFRRRTRVEWPELLVPGPTDAPLRFTPRPAERSAEGR